MHLDGFLCGACGCLPLFSFLSCLLSHHPFHLSLLSQRKEERSSVQIWKKPQQRSPITASVILALLWRKSHVLTRACTGVFRNVRSVVFSHSEKQVIAVGVLLAVCTSCGKILRTLRSPKQKLPSICFQQCVHLTLRYSHSTREEECPECNGHLNKCKIASLWTRRTR